MASRTNDNKTCYVLAWGTKYRQQETTETDDDNITVLLKTTDCGNWTEVTEVYTEWNCLLDFYLHNSVIIYLSIVH